MNTHPTVLKLFCFALALLAFTGCGTKGDLQRPPAETAATPAAGDPTPNAGDQQHP